MIYTATCILRQTVRYQASLDNWCDKHERLHRIILYIMHRPPSLASQLAMTKPASLRSRRSVSWSQPSRISPNIVGTRDVLQDPWGCWVAVQAMLHNVQLEKLRSAGLSDNLSAI